jgi:hypothetical protein
MDMRARQRALGVADHERRSLWLWQYVCLSADKQLPRHELRCVCRQRGGWECGCPQVSNPAGKKKSAGLIPMAGSILGAVLPLFGPVMYHRMGPNMYVVDAFRSLRW